METRNENTRICNSTGVILHTVHANEWNEDLIIIYITLYKLLFVEIYILFIQFIFLNLSIYANIVTFDKIVKPK